MRKKFVTKLWLNICKNLKRHYNKNIDFNKNKCSYLKGNEVFIWKI